MLIKKDWWDLIEIGLYKPSTELWEKEKNIKENLIAIKLATGIIKEDINDDIFNNIIDIIDPKEM